MPFDTVTQLAPLTTDCYTLHDSSSSRSRGLCCDDGWNTNGLGSLVQRLTSSALLANGRRPDYQSERAAAQWQRAPLALPLNRRRNVDVSGQTTTIVLKIRHVDLAG